MWGHSTCSLIGLALDEQKQELYAADGGNSHIVVFSTVTGKVVRVLGSGGTGDGQFHMPYGLALDGDLLFVTGIEDKRLCSAVCDSV
jgi:DNA-binding beta-propeller fold protein YncE